MLSKIMAFSVGLLLSTLVTICAGSGAIAQESAWHVSKSSGEVWVTLSGAQPAALTNDVILRSGDTLRTGQNGRVLLVRQSESILISANSMVGIPEDKGNGSTTIMQRAGSVLFDVEKQNVPHFEVLTPFLAAVVKGTQFRVTVDSSGSHVDVLRGRVEVAEYKTGQYALVKPGQAASVSLQGPGGLSLSGSGTLSPIQQGTPRRPSVSPLTVAEAALPAPDRADNAQQGPAPASERQAEQAPASQGELGVQQDPAPAWQRQAPHALDRSNGASNESGWAAVVAWGKGVLGFGGRTNGHDSNSLSLAVPAVVGFCVCVGTGVLRQRRKRNHKPGDR